MRPKHPNKTIEAALQVAEEMVGYQALRPCMGNHALFKRGARRVSGLYLVHAAVFGRACKAIEEGGHEMPTLTEAVERTDGAEDIHSFTLLLRGASPLEHLDALYEAGCDDAIFGEREGVFFAEFDRTGTSFAEAIGSAIRQVEAAVPHIRVVRVEPDELVNASAIAARTGRSRESIRLLVEHRRGPGDFPPPMCWVNAKTRLWRWSVVAHWFAEVLGERTTDTDEATFVAALNAALELRVHARELSEAAEREMIAQVVREGSERLRG